MDLKQLKKDVDTIMYNKYEEGLDFYDMRDIVVDKLINNYIYSTYVVLVYGKVIVKQIDKWFTSQLLEENYSMNKEDEQ